MFFRALRSVVRGIDKLNRFVGGIAMAIFFVMLGLLTYGVVTDVILKSPSIWLIEMAQFIMAAYYLLGGGYTLQRRAHVRMDLLYGRWGPRARAGIDCFTGLFLMFYLGVLVWGGILSTEYAFEYNQKNYTAWAPPLGPIKAVMTAGMVLMFLQAFSLWAKDVARASGRKL
jgi:TRAP-type mannitol/chloroaromatic compound transport system permease small subunit